MRHRILTAQDLARIESYAGAGQDLHDLLGAVLPLTEAVEYEATVTAQHGTIITFRYSASPAEGGILIGMTATADGRTLPPYGPVLVTTTGMDRPPGTTDEAWRELRASAGIIIRALLLGL